MSEPGSAKRILAHVLAVIVAGYFLMAAGGKIWEPRQFAMDITNYQMGSPRYSNLIAIFLPWWEVGAALALIVPRTRSAGFILIAGMLLMFITAVSYAALYKGLHISCGCFGKVGAASAGWKTIGIDTALLIAAVLSLVWAPPSRRPMSGFNAVGAAPAGA